MLLRQNSTKASNWVRLLSAAGFISGFSLQAPAATLAQKAALMIGGDFVVVGREVGAAATYFECKPDTIQQTIKRCRLKKGTVAKTLGAELPVEEVNANIHFQGDVVNMSVFYNGKISASEILEQYKKALGMHPKVEFWADDDHLNKSYIWIENECNEPGGAPSGGTEVEISIAVKGGEKESRPQVFISSLAGNRPPNPADVPQ